VAWTTRLVVSAILNNPSSGLRGQLARHLALSQQGEAYAKQFPVVTICLFLRFVRSPGHPVDEIHVHGGFLAEEGDLVVDMDVCTVPASATERYSA
jgi:hypothetical protein